MKPETTLAFYHVAMLSFAQIVNKKEESVDNQDLYNILRDAIVSIRRNINDVEKDIQAGKAEYHHPQELLAMLMATRDLCEFIFEHGMENVDIEKGQESVQIAIIAYKRYTSVATKSERRVHDFEDTIFFLQWLLSCPQTNN